MTFIKYIVHTYAPRVRFCITFKKWIEELAQHQEMPLIRSEGELNAWIKEQKGSHTMVNAGYSAWRSYRLYLRRQHKIQWL